MCGENYITGKNFIVKDIAENIVSVDPPTELEKVLMLIMSDSFNKNKEDLRDDTESEVDWFKHATLITLPELYEEVLGWRRRFPQFEYSQKWDCIIQRRNNE